MTITRCVTEYDKVTRQAIDQHMVDCDVADMRKLFDIDDDFDMMYVYQITTKEQKAFFVNLGVPLETGGLYYLESWGDLEDHT